MEKPNPNLMLVIRNVELRMDANTMAALITRIAYDMISVETGDIDFETFIDITRAAMKEQEEIILRYTGGTHETIDPRTTRPNP